MLVRIFKSNQKLVSGLVLLFTVLLWIPSFVIEQENQVNSFISTGFFWIDLVLSIILIAIQAIYLNMIVNNYKLVENNTHLTSLMFVTLNSCFLVQFNLNEVLIANTFLLLGIHQLLRLYDAKGGLNLSFNAGLLISIAAVIYFPNAIFLLLLWCGIIYLITPKWRDFVVTLLGFSIPVIYILSYNFVFGKIETLDWSTYNVQVFSLNWDELGLANKGLVFLLIGSIILAFMKIASRLNKGALRTQKMLVLIILMALFGLGTLMLNKGDYLATFVVLTIPISIIMANFFQEFKKQWLTELLFTCLIILMLLGYFS